MRTELGIPHVAIPVRPRRVDDTDPADPGLTTGADPESTVPAMPAVSTTGPGPRGTQALPRGAMRQHAAA
ncbi:hypothetical protein, partial [Saccharomonospora iraqiensis]|uniref:hypothetical protein n=1 Tax=Saccharomonospora iraqiensis TaxID=52698 RepID=UPI0005949260